MKNKITALYVRVSTDLQANGLDSQIKALEQHCKIKEILNYKIYQDFGISGAKSSRPELDQMMLDCANGLIENVIVYSFSRLARSTKLI
ncbi:MAG: recombinase family protein [Pseudobdellovibrio sp.]